jgi:VIT1/CCC1 family predicted Fe2+/Mn2+ transporter
MSEQMDSPTNGNRDIEHGTKELAGAPNYDSLNEHQLRQPTEVARALRTSAGHEPQLLRSSRARHLILEAHRARHQEEHTDSSGVVQDAILGAADGLTVPFALAAGLSGAFTQSSYIVLAVLSELVAGGISMGLGGWLAGRSEVQTFESERAREEHEVQHVPLAEEAEIYEIFRPYGVPESAIESVLAHFREHPRDWVDFMMKFELGLSEPDRNRPWRSAITVGGAYVLGGLVPLIPYLVIGSAKEALRWSIFFTFLALLLFGWVKAGFTGQGRWKSAIETAAVGGCAAAAAYGIARWFDSITARQ